MDTVPVQPWVQSDTLRKSQTVGSAVDAAASDGTDADDVEVTAASASSTSFQKGEEIWDMQDMASTQNNHNDFKRGKTALFVATVAATANLGIQIQLLDCHSRLIPLLANSIICKFHHVPFTANFHYLQIPPPLLPKSITCNFSAPILGQKEATLNIIFSIFERRRAPQTSRGPGKLSPLSPPPLDGPA